MPRELIHEVDVEPRIGCGSGCLIFIVLFLLFSRFIPDEIKNDSKPVETPAQIETQKTAPAQESKKDYPVVSFDGVLFKQLYSYEPLGFYIFLYSANGSDFDPNILSSMSAELPYNSSNGQFIYIFESMPDLQPIINAPKKIPLTLTVPTEKQYPLIKFTSLKGSSDTICIFNTSSFKYDNYYKNSATDWGFVYNPDDNTNKCNIDYSNI